MNIPFIQTGVSASENNDNYELRVLTFEDKEGENYWSELIAKDQYSDPRLYGSVTKEENAYKWCDKANTKLQHTLPYNYGSYSYWGGGHAISNYASTDFESFGDYMSQLTVFMDKEYEEGILERTGGGNNGSDNFAVHFGYADDSGYNGIDNLPALSFADGKARVIDHMYVNVTTYPLYCYLEGNGFTEPLGDNDTVKIVATGYNGNIKTKSTEFELVNFSEGIFVVDWSLWDLSVLGAVTKVEFNMAGTSDNGFGFSQPAYFAYDDVAVRFELPTVNNINISKSNENTYNYSYSLSAPEIVSGKTIIALYSAKKLVGIDITDVNNGDNNVHGNVSVREKPDNYSIMLLNDLEEIIPLCDAVKGNLN